MRALLIVQAPIFAQRQTALLRDYPLIKGSPFRFISRVTSCKSSLAANIHRIHRMNLPVRATQRIAATVKVWMPARMMTAVKEQVTLQPQRMPLDFFVVLSVVDPGPTGGAEVRNDLSANAIAEVVILTSRKCYVYVNKAYRALLTTNAFFARPVGIEHKADKDNVTTFTDGHTVGVGCDVLQGVAIIWQITAAPKVDSCFLHLLLDNVIRGNCC